jgi:hypothetical protein
LQLARIANLQHLTSLRVTDVNLQGADLEQLAKMEGLQHLAAVQSNLRSNYDCGVSAATFCLQVQILSARSQYLPAGKGLFANTEHVLTMYVLSCIPTQAVVRQQGLTKASGGCVP